MSVSSLQISPDLSTRPLPPGSQPTRNEGQPGSPLETRDPAVRVSLSEAGQRITRAVESASETTTGSGPEPSSGQDSTSGLSPDEQREVEELQKRDREVRAHEAAHKAAAGSLSSGAASFSFTSGPDGRRYATSGEVSIDTSAVSGDPDATIRKLLQVRSAALAPASPSGQDRRVAAQAAATVQAARAEAAQVRLEEAEPTADSTPTSEIASHSGDIGDTHRTDGTARTARGGSDCAICGGQGHGPEIHYSQR